MPFQILYKALYTRFLHTIPENTLYTSNHLSCLHFLPALALWDLTWPLPYFGLDGIVTQSPILNTYAGLEPLPVPPVALAIKSSLSSIFLLSDILVSSYAFLFLRIFSWFFVPFLYDSTLSCPYFLFIRSIFMSIRSENHFDLSQRSLSRHIPYRLYLIDIYRYFHIFIYIRINFSSLQVWLCILLSHKRW